MDQSLGKEAWHFSCQNYACKEDAQSAMNAFTKKLKYHVADFEIKERKHYTSKGRPKNSKGRPKKEQKPDALNYCVELKIERDQQAIDQHMRRKGRFVLATRPPAK